MFRIIPLVYFAFQEYEKEQRITPQIQKPRKSINNDVGLCQKQHQKISLELILLLSWRKVNLSSSGCCFNGARKMGAWRKTMKNCEKNSNFLLLSDDNCTASKMHFSEKSLSKFLLAQIYFDIFHPLKCIKSVRHSFKFRPQSGAPNKLNWHFDPPRRERASKWPFRSEMSPLTSQREKNRKYTHEKVFWRDVPHKKHIEEYFQDLVMQFFGCYGRNKCYGSLKPDPESTPQCASYEVWLAKRPFHVHIYDFFRAVTSALPH